MSQQIQNQKNPIKKGIQGVFFVIAATVLIIGGIILLWNETKKVDSSKQELKKEDKIIAEKGMHWHANLSIIILGQKQEIPADIGISAVHQPIHTHEKDGVIHMEFGNTVKEGDVRLSKFFTNWGKKFSRDCLLDKCNSDEGKVKMTVNGKENDEFENYIMKDGDKIELTYEKIQSVESKDNISFKTTNQPPATKEITVVGNEYSFSPSSIAVKGGEPVRIIFKNEGDSTHNLVIQGLNKQTNTIGSGQVDVLEFTAPASGIYDFICSVSDHRARGMMGKFIAE